MTFSTYLTRPGPRSRDWSGKTSLSAKLFEGQLLCIFGINVPKVIRIWNGYRLLSSSHMSGMSDAKCPSDFNSSKMLKEPFR